MLTEQDRQARMNEDVQANIDFNNEIIVAAAKYERILSNRDFLEILKDIKNVKDVLDKELNVLTTQLLLENGPTERKTVYNEWLGKAIRRLIITEAASYPERIVHEAAVAKEKNIELKAQLKEKQNG